MRIKVLVSLVITAFLLNANAQAKKKNIPIEGIVYNLPRTVIKAKVTAENTQYIAGPFAKYAESMLGIKNIPESDKNIWKITNVEFETFSEADPSHQYKSLGISGTLVALSSNGVIAGINTTAPKTNDNITYSSFIPVTIQKPITNFTDLTMEGRFYSITDSTGTHMVAKTDEEMAQEAVNTIIDIRQQRYDLLSGVLDSNDAGGAQAIKTASEKLENIEKKYLSLFIGITETTNHTFGFDYIPELKQSETDNIIFRFSALYGPVPANDLSGAPVYINIDTQNVLSEGQLTADSPSCLYYRIPQKGYVSIVYGGKTLSTANIDIAQFGTILPLPENLLDGRFEIKLNPETGVIMGTKQIVFEEVKKKK